MYEYAHTGFTRRCGHKIHIHRKPTRTTYMEAFGLIYLQTAKPIMPVSRQ